MGRGYDRECVIRKVYNFELVGFIKKKVDAGIQPTLHT